MSGSSDQRAILLATAIALLLAILLVGGRPDESEQTRLTPISTAPGGGRALALSLGELGLTTGRLDRPWSDWVVDEPRATLLIVGPTRGIDDFEADRLVAWVERGGRLIWVPGELVSGGLAIARPDLPLAERLEVNSRTARAFADGGHRAEPSPALPTAARLALAGAPERWTDWTRAFDVDRPHRAWVEDAAGRPCVTEIEVGQGSVLVWGDTQSLRNDRVAESELAAVFVRAAAVFADDMPLLIDGYAHGLAALGSVPLATWRWLTRTDGGSVALFALGVGLVWLVSNSLRRAPPVPPPRPPGRSSVEHVDALAQAYDRARAHARPARLLIEHAEARLGSVSLARRLDHLRRSEPELRTAIERVQAAREHPESVDRDQLVRLAHDLDAIVAAGASPARAQFSSPPA